MPSLDPIDSRWLAALVALDARCNPHPWSDAQWASALAAGNWGQVLIAPMPDEAASSACPTLLGYYLAMSAVDEAHLLSIAVDTSARGRGYGRALLGAFHTQAAQRGASSAWLEVRVGNAAARSLYSAQGWRSVAQRRHYYAPLAPGLPREDACVMQRVLHAQPRVHI